MTNARWCKQVGFTGSWRKTMHDVAKHDDSKGQYFWVWGALLVADRSGSLAWLNQVFEDRCRCWKC